MNKKWYISVVVVILAFMSGIATQDQVSKPNQEIVLQFASHTVTSDDAQDAIATIKAQLESAGVANIHVTKFENGTLKITYHSSSEVSDIKKILSENASIKIDQKTSDKKPSNESITHFDFDVYEIQTAYDADLDIQGTTTSNPKGDQDRIVQTNPFAKTESNDFIALKEQLKTAYKFYTSHKVVLNDISYKIPEVRAGPISLGMNTIS